MIILITKHGAFMVSPGTFQNFGKKAGEMGDTAPAKKIKNLEYI